MKVNKVLKLGVVFSVFLTLNSSSIEAAAPSSDKNNNENYVLQDIQKNFNVVKKDKKAIFYNKRVHYPQNNNVFSQIQYYEEYNDDHQQWFSGNLTLEKIEFDSENGCYLGWYAGELTNS